MNTPPVPDGPDTELAAAIGFLARNEGLLIEMEHSPAGRAAATIVRAVLARPAAGRDLTAQDVQRAYDGTMRWEPIANYLNRIARPAVARTDGQPPADEPRSSRWLVKDGPDSILGSFATRSAAEEAQERVRPAYPTAWVEQYPARSAVPADDTAAPDAAPRPDWSGAWAELAGYVRAATEPIDPARIDAYMVELKREALRPFREWVEQLAAGQPVRDSQPEATDG